MGKIGMFEEEQTCTKSLILEVKGKVCSEGAEPLARLLIERHENYRHDDYNILHSASIRISYRCVSTSLYSGGGSGTFSGHYSKLHNSVSLTSKDPAHSGAVFLDPEELRGHGIGTYLMNEIVQWVRRWPEAEVNTIELTSNQAQIENKERINRFYEQFGIVFDYTGADKRKGLSRPMLSGILTPIDKTRLNIQERSVFDFLLEIQQAQVDIADRENTIKSLVEEYSHINEKPLRWALKTYCYQNIESVVVFSVLSVALLCIAIRS